jgi:DNA-binding GntR family transcriptional regulator
VTLAVDRREERGRGDASRGTQVYAVLLGRIRSGELRPGMRVREEDVAALLKVSRTPVREAFTRLQARGLLEASSGGLAIAEITRGQIMSLYAMRAVLEGAAARFAAENASQADIAGLKHVSRLFASRRGSAATMARINTAFHEAIYEAAHNRYLTRMLEDLNDSLALLPDTTFSIAGRTAAARREHEAIVTAIEARDPDGAEGAARKHIDLALGARLALLFAPQRNGRS